jgi:hypothetical protein
LVVKDYRELRVWVKGHRLTLDISETIRGLHDAAPSTFIYV